MPKTIGFPLLIALQCFSLHAQSVNLSADDAVLATLKSIPLGRSESDMARKMATELFGKYDPSLLLDLLSEQILSANDAREKAAVSVLIGNAVPFPRQVLIDRLRANPDSHIRLSFLVILSMHEPKDDPEIRALLIDALADKREGNRNYFNKNRGGERVCDEAYNIIMRQLGEDLSPENPISYSNHSVQQRDQAIAKLRKRLEVMFPAATK